MKDILKQIDELEKADKEEAANNYIALIYIKTCLQEKEIDKALVVLNVMLEYTREAAGIEAIEAALKNWKKTLLNK